MKNSKQLSIGWKDLLHGFVTAFLAASLVGIYDSLNQGILPTVEMIKQHALIGLAAGIAYLAKKFMSNSDNELLKKDS